MGADANMGARIPAAIPAPRPEGGGPRGGALPRCPLARCGGGDLPVLVEVRVVARRGGVRGGLCCRSASGGRSGGGFLVDVVVHVDGSPGRGAGVDVVLGVTRAGGASGRSGLLVVGGAGGASGRSGLLGVGR